jgi:hypothetical protein
MAKRFAGAMASFVNAHGNAPSLLAEHYPWDSIGNGTVVDVGGSKGHISVLLAQRYPDLNFVVQDLPEALMGAAEAVPSEVADRNKFQEHDFFMPQTSRRMFTSSGTSSITGLMRSPSTFCNSLFLRCARGRGSLFMIIFFLGPGHCP